MKTRCLALFLFTLASSLAFSQNNVGIGTTTPQAKLDVHGTFKLQNGVIVNGISADSTLSPGSDSLLPTQLAVKKYLHRGSFAPVEPADSSLFSLGESGPIDNISSVFILGNYLYATDVSTYSLRIFDISNPDTLIALGSTTTNLFSPRMVKVIGNTAYVISHCANDNQLSLFDVSDPNNIVPLGHTGSNINWSIALDVVGNVAYVVSTNDPQKLHAFDVSNPNSITHLGSVSGPITAGAFSVKVVNSLAYVVSYDNRLTIFDVSNPATMFPRSSITTNLNFPTDVIVAGNKAYVSSYVNNRLCVFNISNPDAIIADGFTSEGINGPDCMTLHGNYLFVNSIYTGSLCIFDISNPDNLKFYNSVNDYGGISLHFNSQGNHFCSQKWSTSSIVVLDWNKLSDQRTLTLQPDGTTQFSISDWQTDSLQNIYRLKHNVGIGTDAPTAKLHLVGDMKQEGNMSLLGNLKIDSTNTIEFGAGIAGKQIDAGKIGYQAFSSNALDIVGAGTPNNRKLRFFCEGGAQFDGSVVVQNGNVAVPNGWLAIGRDVPAAPLHVNGYVKIDGTNSLEFGAGIPGKQQDAGKIGYQTFSGNALDIIGAGTFNNRRVRFFAERGTLFDGKVSVTDSLIVNGHTRLSGKMKIDGTNTIEFGAGIAGKQIDAGKIGYQTFSGNALDIIGAGTPNQRRIQLFAEAGATVQGKLFVTDSISGTNAKFSGKVGIGTSTPTATLHVAGNQKIDGTNSLEFGAGIPGKQADAGKIGYTLYSNALDIIGAGPAFQRRIKLWAESGVNVEGKLIATDSIIGNNGKLSGNGLIGNNLIVNGSLGIGTNNPGYKLDVNGRLRLRYNGDIAGLYFNNSTNALGGFVGMVNDSYMGIYGQSGAGWSLVTNTTNGNVGIGNTNPNYILDVNGRMRIRNNGETSGVYFNTSANTEGGFVGMYNDSYVGFYGTSGDTWNLVMNTTTGNVGIGLLNPTAPLHLNGNEKINSDYSVEFGAGVSGKQQDAGKIGYQTFTTGALDIVGAGPTSGTRKVKIWDNLIVDKIETEAWTDLNGYLDNFWANYGSGYATAACYKDQFGVVHLRGTLKDGIISSGTLILTLPAGYRPTNGRLVFATVNGVGGFGRVDVLTNGDVLFYGSSSALLSLDQISFRTY